MPSVKEALGALIPAKLAAAKEKLPVDGGRGGSFLRMDSWRVSVYEEETLARGWLDVGMLKLF